MTEPVSSELEWEELASMEAKLLVDREDGWSPKDAARTRDERLTTEQAEAMILPFAKVWIDTRSYEVTKLESAGDIVIEIGPVAMFGNVRWPQWVSIAEPEKTPVLFEFGAVARVKAAPGAFSKAWLNSSLPRESHEGETPEESSAQDENPDAAMPPSSD